MLSHALPLLLLASTPFAAAQVRWPEEGKRDGGNVYLEAMKNRLNWGTVNPVDMVKELREGCGTTGCQVETIEKDTQVVVDGKSHMKKLVMRVTQASFSGNPDIKPGQKDNIVTALEAFVGQAPYVEKSTQHWDQETEGSSCPGAQSKYCWIPNKIEGDADQYAGATSFVVRSENDDGTMIANLQIAAEVQDQDGSEWDCQKIFDTAEQVAGLIDGIDTNPFILGQLFRGLFGIS